MAESGRKRNWMIKEGHLAKSISMDLKDAEIADALEVANIPALMAALVHLTGDAGIIRGEARPRVNAQVPLLDDPQGNITPEQQAEIRTLAFNVIRELRDSGGQLPPPPSPELIDEMMRFAVGVESASGDYVEFLQAGLGLSDIGPYDDPVILSTPKEARADFRVLIIGAGMSGLLAAIRLKQAGVPFTIVEKADEVGGTWRANTYPGCRVDSQNHVYSYSFRRKDWSQYYSRQWELKEYFIDCANENDIRKNIRFNTEVRSARWDEAAHMWNVEVETSSGAEVLTANVVITAVGQLDRPKIPAIPGIETFKGTTFHTAEWDHAQDLKGKRVGIIGSGASAFQVAPQVAREASHVTIFQRTPPWIIVVPHYMADIPAGEHWLFEHVPYYADWFRFLQFWRISEGLMGMATVDPNWQGSNAVNAINDQFRKEVEASMRAIIGDDPELAELVIPKYPIGAKRMVIDDGTYLRTLKNGHVDLTDAAIEAVTPNGVRTADGKEHEFDVIIYATGFQASEFLEPMKIYGTGGKELHDVWNGVPKALNGVTVPGFPNFFMCFGPNTFLVVNGSATILAECQVRYVLNALGSIIEGGHAAIDCKPDALERNYAWLTEGNAKRVWALPGVQSWYKNDAGVVTQIWPFSTLEFWQENKQVKHDDYNFL